MSEKVDTKVSRGDLSAIDDDGFYADPPDNSETDGDKDDPTGDGYIRECVEIQRLLDKYAMESNKRLRATVKIYNREDYTQEFLESLIGR